MFRIACLTFVIVFITQLPAHSQITRTLNTAARTGYLTEDEKQMIYEINLVRRQPHEYINILKPYLKRAYPTFAPVNWDTWRVEK